MYTAKDAFSTAAGCVGPKAEAPTQRAVDRAEVAICHCAVFLSFGG